jgi:hypothetical protein
VFCLGVRVLHALTTIRRGLETALSAGNSGRHPNRIAL